MKIVVADDQKINRFYLKSMLNKNGYEVLLAANGAEALAAMHAENDVGMLISDVRMPVMDGFRLCKALKTDHRLKKIPVIFYAATDGGKKERELAYRLGAEKFIKKPEERKKLLPIVKSLVQPKVARKRFPEKFAVENDQKILRRPSNRLVEKLENQNNRLKKELAAHIRNKETFQENERSPEGRLQYFKGN